MTRRDCPQFDANGRQLPKSTATMNMNVPMLTNDVFCAGCQVPLTSADYDAKACTQCGTTVPRRRTR